MDSLYLIQEALKLDAGKRASMADRLLESLDDLSADEVERLWLDEAQRRDAAVQEGKLFVGSCVTGYCPIESGAWISFVASFNRLAEAELREAVGYYESEAPGLGRRFWLSLSLPWTRCWTIPLLDRPCAGTCGIKA